MGRVTPVSGSLKRYTISLPTPKESLSTPETLPTTEPVTPQIEYTITTEDLPVITPKPYPNIYTCFLYGAGKFTSAGTLYWRILYNGASVRTGNSAIAANTFYTVNSYTRIAGAGDTIGMKLWSDKTDSVWDWKGLFCMATRVQLFKPDSPQKSLISHFRITRTDTTTYPTFSLGSPVKWHVGHAITSTGSMSGEEYADFSFGYMGTFDWKYRIFNPSLKPVTATPLSNTPYGVWFIRYYEDGINVRTNSTSRPDYFCQQFNITWEARKLCID